MYQGYHKEGKMSRGNDKYWVRLDSSRFENGGDIDYLLSQKGGSEYVSLYIKLCLVTRNTNGMLATEFGKDIIIPYDIDKIVRECKYFSRNTVLVAMEAYKKLGLIYTNQDGNLVIADYEDIMRKESSSAERVRALRKKQREALHCNAHCNKSVTPDVTQKEESTDGSFPPPFINNNKSPLSSSFTREEKEPPSKIGACEENPTAGPSLDEVKAYFEGNMLKGSPEIFFFHHESIGWRDPQGRAITNWRARAKKWHYDEAKYYPQGNSGDVNTGMQKDLKKGVSDL